MTASMVAPVTMICWPEMMIVIQFRVMPELITFMVAAVTTYCTAMIHLVFLQLQETTTCVVATATTKFMAVPVMID